MPLVETIHTPVVHVMVLHSVQGLSLVCILGPVKYQQQQAFHSWDERCNFVASMTSCLSRVNNA